MAIKTVLIFLLALAMYGCLGEYPNLKTDSNGKVYNANTQTKDDSMLTIDVSEARYPLNYSHYTDSTKIYWQRFNKYQKLMNLELDKINRFQNPTINKKIFRYQDSCNRYQELLNRLKK